MVDFSPKTTSLITAAADWNPLLDHGLEKTVSYIVRKNGSYYEAIKGGTNTGAGTIAFGGVGNVGSISGVSAAAVISAAVAACTTGGIIFISKGIYSITASIALVDGITIDGEYNFALSEGGFGTELHLDANVDMFTITGTGAYTGYKRGINLRHLRLDGNTRTYRAIVAINTHYVVLEQVTFYDFAGDVTNKGSAIKATACWEWTLDKCYFTSCGTLINPQETAVVYLYNGDESGAQCNAWSFVNCRFAEFKAVCIYGDGSGASTIKFHSVIWVNGDNWFHGNADAAANRPNCYDIEGAFTESLFNGNTYVFSNYGFMKFTYTSNRLTITNERMTNLTSYAIYLDGATPNANYLSRTNISNNDIEYHGVGETGDCNSNGIIYSLEWGNITANGNTVEIQNSGAHDKTETRLFYGGGQIKLSNYTLHELFNNYTYFSEVYGTATGASPITVTNHYLANSGASGRNTPTMALVTAYGAKDAIVPSQASVEYTASIIKIYHNGSAVYSADAGGDTTHIVDAALTQANDAWNGFFIEVLSGVAAGQKCLVTDFDAATDTLVTTALTVALGVGDLYKILGSAGTVNYYIEYHP